jgi:hypothetical protein
MSPALLSKRLHELTRAGLVVKESDGSEVRYTLSPAGMELRPIVEALASWGVRWIGELGDQDLDPKLLLWDMHRHVDHDAVPGVRTVLAFDFDDVPPKIRHWWLVITPTAADVCDRDPGYDVAVRIRSTLRTMTRIWRGDISWSAVASTGRLHLDGPADLRRSVPDWFSLPVYAGVERRSKPRSSTGAEWVSAPTAM